MAKVTGPLHSDDARNQFGKSIVFMGWKGLKTARMYLKPAQPKDPKQGDVRIILGGCGRGTRVVEPASLYIGDAKLVAAPYQSWVSTLVQYIIKNYMIDLTAYLATVADYEAVKVLAEFEEEAAGIGLVDFTLAYKTATMVPFTAGMQLYILGLYGIAKRSPDEVFDRAPYDTAMADWTDVETGKLVADLEAVV